MKNVLKLAGAAAAAVALLVSCSKQEVSCEGQKVQMTVIAGSDNVTRTVLGSDGKVTWATTGETIEVIEVAGSNVSSYVSSEGVTNDSGQTMTFGVSLTASEETSFDYYAIYPSSAYVTKDNTSVTNFKVLLNASQTPTATSFGTDADLLISKPVTGQTEQPTTLELQFARLVAVGKMTIKDLNTTENVKKVTFTASDKTLAGKSYVNLATGLVSEYGYGAAMDNLILDYSGQTVAANGMTAYFTCWPCEFVKDDTFTVKVETESKVFTKTITIPSDGALAFKEGRSSTFAVSFSGIEGEDTEKDLTGASLTYDEIKDDTKWGDAYTTIYTYTQSSGAVWTIACYKSASIQLGNCTKNDNAGKSYIKLPDFKESISSVEISLYSPLSSEKNLFFATSSSATSGDIASVTGDGKTKEYVFDLSDKNAKTAYLRATAVTQILSINVIVGEDTRTALSTPQNVKASLESGSVNSIKVEWDVVENAGSYTVTATSAAGDAISQTITTNSCTFSGLSYETAYFVSVVAEPSDISKYLDSAASAAVSVTTDAKPSGATSYVEDFSGQTLGGAASYSGTTAVTWTHSLSETAWSAKNVSNKISSLSSNNKVIAIGKSGNVTFSGSTGVTALSFDYLGANNSTKTLKVTVTSGETSVCEKVITVSKTASGSVKLTSSDFSAVCEGTFTVTIANTVAQNAIQISAINWTSAK